MFVPLSEAATTVDGPLINIAGAIVGVGGLLLTYAWLAGLYRD